jgi:RNA polymerase sigma-70 factor (ECF subfamily)
MQQQELLPHLFRTEFSKITSVLTRYMGMGHLQAAEDIASETFLSALETWSFKGIPPNPTGWLYVVAKNKAKNYINRNKIFRERIIPDVSSAASSFEPEIDLSEQNISDSQLQMLFAVCHPSIPEESQVALSLRILCGFGIDEIATAFLTSKETINKRLFRAKEKLREQKIELHFPPASELQKRLETVLLTLYLLFNEGYYSETDDAVIREDLCFEAMRLTALLLENSKTNIPSANALMALMCFHSSRFAARKSEIGEMILYQQQDSSLWNQQLVAKGAEYLAKASVGDRLSKYHIEAAIAYWNTIKEDSKEKWTNILSLYDQLLSLQYSPIAALNRVFALSKVTSNKVALAEAEKLQLHHNHYYHTLLGELYRDIDNQKSREHLLKAYALARSATDKSIIQDKINLLSSASSLN